MGGYSDFSTNATSQSFAFSNNNTNPVSHGANALKLENEITTEKFNESIDEVNNQYHEELLKNQEVESIVENTSDKNEISFSQEAISDQEIENNISNDLKEVGVDTDEPDLFNSEHQEPISE